MDWYRSLRVLRANGWMVASHNDYRQDGKLMTFWLLTHPSGVYVRGEGETDEIAILQCKEQVRSLNVVASSDRQPPSAG